MNPDHITPEDWTPQEDEWLAEHLRSAQEEMVREYQQKQRAWNDFLAAWQCAKEAVEQPLRKRPAELDDKDRKNPWGHIPYHK